MKGNNRPVIIAVAGQWEEVFPPLMRMLVGAL